MLRQAVSGDLSFFAITMHEGDRISLLDWSTTHGDILTSFLAAISVRPSSLSHIHNLAKYSRLGHTASRARIRRIGDISRSNWKVTRGAGTSVRLWGRSSRSCAVSLSIWRGRSASWPDRCNWIAGTLGKLRSPRDGRIPCSSLAGTRDGVCRASRHRVRQAQARCQRAWQSGEVVTSHHCLSPHASGKAPFLRPTD